MDAPLSRESRIKQTLFGSRKRGKNTVTVKREPERVPSEFSIAEHNVGTPCTPSIDLIPPFTSPSRRKNADPKSPPRPPNVWILYRRYYMRKFLSKTESSTATTDLRTSPTKGKPSNSRRSTAPITSSPSAALKDDAASSSAVTQGDVSREIAKQWAEEPASVKYQWERLAQEHKAWHREQYPGYKYQPRRKVKTDDEEKESDDDGDDNDDDPKLHFGRESSPTAQKMARAKSNSFSGDTTLSSNKLTPGKRASESQASKAPVVDSESSLTGERNSTSRLHEKDVKDVLGPRASASSISTSLPTLHRAASADVLRSIDAKPKAAASLKSTAKRTRSSARTAISAIDVSSPSKRTPRKTNRSASANRVDSEMVKPPSAAVGGGGPDAWQLFSANEKQMESQSPWRTNSATIPPHQRGFEEEEHVEELDERRTHALSSTPLRAFDGGTLYAPVWRATAPMDGLASTQQQQFFDTTFDAAAIPSSPRSLTIQSPVFDAVRGSGSSVEGLVFELGAAHRPSTASVSVHLPSPSDMTFLQPEAGASAAEFAPYHRRNSREYGSRLGPYNNFAGSATSLSSAPPQYGVMWDNPNLHAGGGARGTIDFGYAPSASSNGSLVSLHSAPATTLHRSFDENSDYAAYLAAGAASSLNRLSPGESSAVSESIAAPSPSDSSSCAASLTNAFRRLPPLGGSVLGVQPDINQQEEHRGSWSDAGIFASSPSERMASASYLRANDETHQPPMSSRFLPYSSHPNLSATDSWVSNAIATEQSTSSTLPTEYWASQSVNAAAIPSIDHPGYTEQAYAQHVFGGPSVLPFPIYSPHSAPTPFVEAFPRNEEYQHHHQHHDKDETTMQRDMQFEQFIDGLSQDTVEYRRNA